MELRWDELGSGSADICRKESGSGKFETKDMRYAGIHATAKYGSTTQRILLLRILP